MERKFGRFSLQTSPTFSNVRYIQDFTNSIYVYNGIDWAVDVIVPIDAAKQTFLNAGVATSFIFSQYELQLDGTKVSGLSSTPIGNPTQGAVMVKIGLGLNLSEGVRFQFNYFENLDGKQESSTIKGKPDYFQFGVQLRLNELANSDRVNAKQVAEIERIEAAYGHTQNLKDSATMVFVVNTRDAYNYPWADSSGKANAQTRAKEARQNYINAINRYYTFGSFVIISDTDLKDFVKEANPTVNITDTDGNVIETQILSPNRYYAKLDELFVAENGRLNWGIFVFDHNMDMVESPFPYFTRYRSADQSFTNSLAVDLVVNELNSALEGMVVSGD